MSSVIRLKDFTPVNKGFSNDPNDNILQICKELQDEIDTKEELTIININGDKEKKPCIFSSYNDEYSVQKYVGVLEYNGNKITIGSRFDSDDNQYFLQYVFSKAFDMNGKIFDDMNTFGKSEDSWDLLLIMVFIKQLKEAMKKGLYRTYRSYQYNDSKIKGQIDIARHLKINVHENGKVAYNSREYTIDNYNNYLFLKAFEIIEKKYPSILKKLISSDDNVKNGIGYLKSKLGNEYNNQEILKNTTKKIVHPIYRKYESLRKTSILIIRKLGINSMNTDDSKVTGFVIDMTKLWEQFLEKTMFKKIDNNNYISQDKFNILNGKRELIPDFYWASMHLVIDAKYRSSWGMTLKGDWSGVRDDVFQVLAYMLSLDCNLGGVVFPVDSNITFPYDEKLSVFPDGNQNKVFFRLPYFIKKNDNYLDFSRNMEQQEEFIISKIKNYLTRN